MSSSRSDRLFQLKKRSKQARDRHIFKLVKHLIQLILRSAYDKYLQDLLGLAALNCRWKSLWIKDARQDSQAISPFMDKSKNILVTENKKATILNKQFQSVFSQLFHLRLDQLCIEKVQEIFEISLKILNVNIQSCRIFWLILMEFWNYWRILRQTKLQAQTTLNLLFWKNWGTRFLLLSEKYLRRLWKHANFQTIGQVQERVLPFKKVIKVTRKLQASFTDLYFVYGHGTHRHLKIYPASKC